MLSCIIIFLGEFKMKKLFYFTIALLLFSCSNNNIEETSFTPKAVSDKYSTLQNRTFIISSILENDEINGETIITKFDHKTLNYGTVQRNSNGTFSYIPKKNFTGVDSFEYTICNDKKCTTAKVVIKVNELEHFAIPKELKDYYVGIDTDLTAFELKEKLKNIISDYKVLRYIQRHDFLYKMDADFENRNDVVLMYTGEKRYWRQYQGGSYKLQTFNTEHIYPQSKLTSSNAVTDLHHLRACDSEINSLRSNLPFTNGSGKCKRYKHSWYPGDEWKGDVARMVMYLHIVHNEDFNKVGSLELFLKWNVEDPVSKFEKQRNREAYKAQNNRNPFIDNPYLATLLFGGVSAENLWK